MNGKDLLAVLAMILPGILLIALIALALVPASVLQPFPGSGELRGDNRKNPDPPSSMRKAHAMHLVSTRATQGTATQKRMRNPWEKQTYAKN